MKTNASKKCCSLQQLRPSVRAAYYVTEVWSLLEFSLQTTSLGGLPKHDWFWEIYFNKKRGREGCLTETNSEIPANVHSFSHSLSVVIPSTSTACTWHSATHVKFDNQKSLLLQKMRNCCFWLKRKRHSVYPMPVHPPRPTSTHCRTRHTPALVPAAYSSPCIPIAIWWQRHAPKGSPKFTIRASVPSTAVESPWWPNHAKKRPQHAE